MKIQNEQILVKVFDARIEELIDLSLSLEGRSCASMYTEVLVNWLQDNREKLNAIVNKISDSPEIEYHEIVLALSTLRLKVSRGEYSDDDIEGVLEVAKKYPLWLGEAHAFCAFAYGDKGNDVKAKILFKKAYNYLLEIGANQRALLSLQNFITAESNLYPEKSLFAEYKLLISRAKNFNFLPIAGTAYLNLSREYQKRGAIQSALEEVDNSLECLESVSGIPIYFLAIAHKSDLLIDLGLKPKAKVLMEKLNMSNNKKVIGAKKSLLEKLGKLEENENIEMNELSPSWKERFLNVGKNIKLGELEEKMLDFVSEGPKSKVDIIEHLYGDQIDYYVLENRFKNLIGRFRKKVPDTIVFINGMYQLSMSSLIEEVDEVS